VIDNLNRAFLYGESVFTTMRMQNGVLRDWEMHFDRLKKSSEFIYGPFTDKDEWTTRLRTRLETKLAEFDGDKVIRITIYREQQRGVLRGNLIGSSDLRFHVNHSLFDPTRFENKTLKLRTCPISPRPHWWPSYLKTGNYLETILCQKIYMRPEDDDVLFLSGDDTILESSVANIFVVRHNKLYTAPSGPNVLDGVMRRKVIRVATDFFSDFEESSTSMEQILKADAVFGSNSIRGLFLVDRIDDYEISYTEEFLDKFLKLKTTVLI
jgi:branched-subunit amino acid aminotransferase/4-amino-4-deoxychorismate lyase